MFSLQVLGAVAQLERALIAERTRSGLARARGRLGAIPACAPVIRTPSPNCAQAAKRHLEGVLARLDTWLPTVRQMRPNQGDHRFAAAWRGPASRPR
jgi:Resolvase, N terminal domain